MTGRLLLIGLLVAVSTDAARAACGNEDFEGRSYVVCRYDPAQTQIELFNLNPEGKPFERFQALAQTLAGEGKELIFATNAGMFDEALKPVGLYVEDGEQRKKLNRRGGAGNFHLKPNGVFWIDDGKAGVSETEAYAKSGRKPDFATQSGPMLVINGRIHPKISPTGTSLKVRNGVGVTASGEVVFALSENVVSFHEFARLFRDGQNCPNALFLDGSVSGLYSVETGQVGGYLPLGPMVGAYQPK